MSPIGAIRTRPLQRGDPTDDGETHLAAAVHGASLSCREQTFVVVVLSIRGRRRRVNRPKGQIPALWMRRKEFFDPADDPLRRVFLEKMIRVINFMGRRMGLQ